VTEDDRRIMAVDWLRGLSVLFMIQHHATDLLLPALKLDRAYAMLDRVDGLVAPAFTLVAGFSLGLVQVRSRGSRSRVSRTLFRIAQVLAAATFVNWLWFPIFREPRWLLRLDILHCLGFSLLLALPISVSLARRPSALRFVALAIGLTIFAVTPLLERVPGSLGNFLNVNEGSVFPLLPWAGYVFLGLCLGAAAGEGRARLRSWTIAIGLIGGLVFVLTPLWQVLYPPHTFWISNPGRHGDRWALCCAVLLGLMAVERRVPAQALASAPLRLPVGLVDFFGRASLSSYVVHEMLLYYPIFGFSLTGSWGNRCGWLLYSVLTSLLIAATYAGCQAYVLAEEVAGKLWQALLRFAYRGPRRRVL
jgi:uncharacterized membrane protein